MQGVKGMYNNNNNNKGQICRALINIATWPHVARKKNYDPATLFATKAELFWSPLQTVSTLHYPLIYNSPTPST